MSEKFEIGKAAVIAKLTVENYKLMKELGEKADKIDDINTTNFLLGINMSLQAIYANYEYRKANKEKVCTTEVLEEVKKSLEKAHEHLDNYGIKGKK